MSRDRRRPDAILISPAQLTRRAWLGTAAASLVFGCAGQRWEVHRIEPDDDGSVTISLADHPEIVTPGGMLALAPKGQRHPILVQRLHGEQFVVLSLRCPHLGCTVRWDDQAQVLRCPCHGSRFSDGGQVLKGPAKSSLPRYPYRFDPVDLELRIDLEHPRT